MLDTGRRSKLPVICPFDWETRTEVHPRHNTRIGVQANLAQELRLALYKIVHGVATGSCG